MLDVYIFAPMVIDFSGSYIKEAHVNLEPIFIEAMLLFAMCVFHFY